MILTVLAEFIIDNLFVMECLSKEPNKQNMPGGGGSIRVVESYLCNIQYKMLKYKYSQVTKFISISCKLVNL